VTRKRAKAVLPPVAAAEPLEAPVGVLPHEISGFVLDLATLEARLVAFYEAEADPDALGAARVLEGVRECLSTQENVKEKVASHGPRRRSEVLKSCGAQLLHEARGPTAQSRYARGDRERSRQAVRLQAIVMGVFEGVAARGRSLVRRRSGTKLGREEITRALQRTGEPKQLALVLHNFLEDAPDIMKQPQLDSPEYAKWVHDFSSHLLKYDAQDPMQSLELLAPGEKVCANHLSKAKDQEARDRGRRKGWGLCVESLADYAERVVRAAATASSVKRPSALFDSKAKSLKHPQ
jgi:hypothetical protein